MLLLILDLDKIMLTQGPLSSFFFSFQVHLRVFLSLQPLMENADSENARPWVEIILFLIILRPLRFILMQLWEPLDQDQPTIIMFDIVASLSHMFFWTD